MRNQEIGVFPSKRGRITADPPSPTRPRRGNPGLLGWQAGQPSHPKPGFATKRNACLSLPFFAAVPCINVYLLSVSCDFDRGHSTLGMTYDAFRHAVLTVGLFTSVFAAPAQFAIPSLPPCQPQPSSCNWK
ncbi:unnamed protein product [Boreogadus saida]